MVFAQLIHKPLPTDARKQRQHGVKCAAGRGQRNPIRRRSTQNAQQNGGDIELVWPGLRHGCCIGNFQISSNPGMKKEGWNRCDKLRESVPRRQQETRLRYEIASPLLASWLDPRFEPSSPGTNASAAKAPEIVTASTPAP